MNFPPKNPKTAPTTSPIIRNISHSLSSPEAPPLPVGPWANETKLLFKRIKAKEKYLLNGFIIVLIKVKRYIKIVILFDLNILLNRELDNENSAFFRLCFYVDGSVVAINDYLPAQ